MLAKARAYYIYNKVHVIEALAGFSICRCLNCQRGLLNHPEDMHCQLDWICELKSTVISFLNVIRMGKCSPTYRETVPLLPLTWNISDRPRFSTWILQAYICSLTRKMFTRKVKWKPLYQVISEWTNEIKANKNIREQLASNFKPRARSRS